MHALQKLAGSGLGFATSDSEAADEHVISIIERPSQMMMTMNAARTSAGASPAIHPHHRHHPDDQSQQLVERIEQLYRQTRHPQHAAAATTV